MYCPECGTKNDINAKFCKKCGHKLAVEKKKNDTSQSNAKQSLDGNKNISNIKTQPVISEKRSKKKNHGWLWIILILLVVLIAGVVGWIYIFDSPTSSSSSSDKTTYHSSKTSKAQDGTSSVSASPYKDFSSSSAKGLIASSFDGVSGKNSFYIGPTDTKISPYSQNNAPQRAASDIKIYVMATVFSQMKQNKFDMNDTYTLKDSDKVGGTGKVQNMGDGTKLSMQELMDYMMQDSDNTAANIIIRKLGGLNVVNDEITHLGFKDTKLERYLMDTDALKEGKDNMTSVNDLGTILTDIYNKKLISSSYDEQMLQILNQDEDHSKLLEEIPGSVSTYNKTGDYPDYGVQNDAAILCENGRSYVVVAMLENGSKDDQTSALNDLGKQVYEKYLED
ncbi:hypothetical protein AYR57_04770 [Pediococcus claussenii]|uniref:serine hydrolase n=1 Tax=Pediococcus claussenii TaxID=187452 RepID=UPI00081A6EC9|nr:serine hydrolase [Pediococcus claussenii]ANZ69667.1 hypothetical protein AYR57_04770 [Pediococcus claussenii]